MIMSSEDIQHPCQMAFLMHARNEQVPLSEEKVLAIMPAQAMAEGVALELRFRNQNNQMIHCRTPVMSGSSKEKSAQYRYFSWRLDCNPTTPTGSAHIAPALSQSFKSR